MASLISSIGSGGNMPGDKVTDGSDIIKNVASVRYTNALKNLRTLENTLSTASQTLANIDAKKLLGLLIEEAEESKSAQVQDFIRQTGELKAILKIEGLPYPDDNDNNVESYAAKYPEFCKRIQEVIANNSALKGFAEIATDKVVQNSLEKDKGLDFIEGQQQEIRNKKKSIIELNKAIKLLPLLHEQLQLMPSQLIIINNVRKQIREYLDAREQVASASIGEALDKNKRVYAMATIEQAMERVRQNPEIAESEQAEYLKMTNGEYHPKFKNILDEIEPLEKEEANVAEKKEIAPPAPSKNAAVDAAVAATHFVAGGLRATSGFANKLVFGGKEVEGVDDKGKPIEVAVGGHAVNFLKATTALLANYDRTIDADKGKQKKIDDANQPMYLIYETVEFIINLIAKILSVPFQMIDGALKWVEENTKATEEPKKEAAPAIPAPTEKQLENKKIIEQDPEKKKEIDTEIQAINTRLEENSPRKQAENTRIAFPNNNDPNEIAM